MIRITRSNNIPATLTSKDVMETQEEIRKIAAGGKPTSKQFSPFWGKKDVREALWLSQYKKCAYCERRRDVNRESDIDHFRPKAEVTSAPQHKGYWWLAYDWNNLLFCCRYCNQQYKLNHFPVPDEQHRAATETEPVARERAYFIDPSSEDPEGCFTYHIRDLRIGPGEVERHVYLMHRPGDEWAEERADKTIKILGLNRQDLLEERGRCVEKLEMLIAKMHYAKHLMDKAKIDEAAAEIRQATARSQPFAGFCREFFRLARLGDYVSTD